MKHIWKVKVYFQEDIEDKAIETMDAFNVEAANDIEARKKGIECAKREYVVTQIQYAEIEHVLDFED